MQTANGAHGSIPLENGTKKPPRMRAIDISHVTNFSRKIMEEMFVKRLIFCLEIEKYVNLKAIRF